MVFQGSLSDSKSPQVPRTLFSILTVLNNVVVWMVSTRPPTSKSSRPFINPFAIVPKAPITISTIVTFMCHSFFNSLARSKYLSFFPHSFSFILWSAKSTIFHILFLLLLLLIIIRSGLLAEIRWSVCKSKSHSLCVSFSRTGARLCIYHLLVWSNLNFLHISHITLPTQSCLVLYPLLICCIRLLCDWSFRLCHRIGYICYFVESCLFSLWYDWFLWRCPVNFTYFDYYCLLL